MPDDEPRDADREVEGIDEIEDAQEGLEDDLVEEGMVEEEELEEDLEVLVEGGLVEEDLVEDLEEDLVEDSFDVDDFAPGEEPPEGLPKAKREPEEPEDEDEEELDPDDVEADLDTILKDRIAAQPDDEEDEDDEAPPEPDDRGGEARARILPRRPGEFVCQSCFLVKHPSQLADRARMYCTDCV